MRFQNTLDNLRSKPEHIRKRYAFWSSLAITMTVFAFWLGSFSNIEIGAKQTVASAVDKAGSPAQSLIAGVGAFGQSLRDLILGPKKIEYSEVEIYPGR